MQPSFDLSFEFFPPKTPAGDSKLKNTWQSLSGLQPSFFSVTFGAGGSTREKTAETVYAIQQDVKITAAPHISCMGSTDTIIRAMLNEYLAKGVKHLLALRGDFPSGMGGAAGHFQYANELVEFIRKETGDQFYIDVAAYPEFHPEANGADADFQHFRRKIAAGADSAITQYFYNVDAYFYFLDLCQKHGVNVPVIPGIMPISNFAGVVRFSKVCGAEIPLWLYKRCEAYGDDEVSLKAFGIEVVTKLCEALLDGGAPGLHFYTLNSIEPTMTICKNLF